MTFDEWLFKVCEAHASKCRREPHDILPYIDMTDAKLSYLDGISPDEYKL